ncbi:MAG: knotted carbamoyltransferase YgeW [Bdellovibrionales bacterium RIFOXYD1_FULL_44_7]|nr:MAG: knotted carbamoyltransferase YgeW [Bdellovibrionales bacterium RIFOXYD1_FULL_44_7]
MEKFNQLMKELEALKIGMYEKDFLLTWEKSHDEILATLKVAESLKNLYDRNISTKVFESGLAVSQFRDNSTRTRFSFASACNMLGLAVQDLDEGKSQIAHGETVRETSNMISFLTEVVGIRDDMYLGAGNAYMREVSKALDGGYKEGVLHQRPAVVNLQCDVDHPTQSMADLLHLKTYFGSLEKLKGKKIAMTWAYSPSYGKPLSVPQGIIGLMSRFGMNVTLAYPEGYSLIPDCIEVAKQNSKKSGGSFQLVNSMEDAFKDADIVYPKSWAPYAVMGRRTELLRAKDNNGLKELEKECLANNAKYKSWECTEEKMKLTRNQKALYMHCLPADITNISCSAGEVQDTVFDRYRIETYKEAGFKPYIIASMIFLSRFKDASNVLKSLNSRNVRRKF